MTTPFFEEMEFACECCGEDCNPIIIEGGIGPYEFWGAKYHDSRPYVASDCCEGTVLHYGQEYTVSDYGDDHYPECDYD